MVVTRLFGVYAAEKAGIVVTLATARRYSNTTKIAAELGLATPLILYDGAMIVRYPQGTILHTQPLRAEVGQQAVELLVRHRLQPVVHPTTGMEEQIWTGPADFDNSWVTAYFASFPEQLPRLPFYPPFPRTPDPTRSFPFT